VPKGVIKPSTERELGANLTEEAIAELTELGWEVRTRENGEITFSHDKPSWPESARAFHRLRHATFRLSVDVDTLAGMESLRELKSLSSLDVDHTQVRTSARCATLKASRGSTSPPRE
jgi:hypothetical protein